MWLVVNNIIVVARMFSYIFRVSKFSARRGHKWSQNLRQQINLSLVMDELPKPARDTINRHLLFYLNEWILSYLQSVQTKPQ